MKNPIKTKEKKFKLQGSYKFQGLPISVENKAGSERTGTDKDGKKWSTKMLYDYGFIRNTEATDGEGVDAFINRENNGKKENYHKKEGEPEMVDTDIYAAHQKQGEKSKKWPNGICPDCHKHHTECKCPQYYDEDKVMLGFESKEAAIEAYLKHYDSPRFLGPVSTYTLPEFKTALKNSTGKKLPYVVKKHEHWTGVDLDGTLAKDDGWKGKDHIGEPVERMRERIMAHLDKGDKVKLLTARASDPKAIQPIKQWMKENNIPILEITNKKDPGMINLYDDRVTQVKKNTGELVKSISQTYYVDLDKALVESHTRHLKSGKIVHVRQHTDSRMKHEQHSTSTEEVKIKDWKENGVKSKAFKDWFGDSKVVDSKGNPLVVYHGTSYGNIQSFTPKGGREEGENILSAFRDAKNNDKQFAGIRFRSGSYFSPDPNYAGNYANDNKGSIYPVYIKSENPLYFDVNTKEVRITDESKTADSFIMIDDGKITEIAVIDPTQVKSIFNKGTFDINSDDIIKSFTGIDMENILPVFFTIEDLLEDPEGYYQEYGKENETKDDFLIRMTRKIRDMEFNRATEYHVNKDRRIFHSAHDMPDLVEVVLKSCGKVHEMDKSHLGQEGDPHGSRSMLRENLDKPYYVYRPPTTMSGMLDEIEKSYPDNAMEGESADDYFRRMSREHSNAQVRELLEKAFVRVPAHTRKGKQIPEYHYFTDREKKVADVRHQTKTRVDYGKKEADAKIAELNKKKEHHDMHIQAANDLKEKVESDRKAGKSTYKIGNKEHNINKVLKDLNDHIKHHVNEKKSHDNHIQKIHDRHKTEQAYWDKKREERNAKQQALDELLKDGKHKGEMLESDVLDVLKKMKERDTKKIEVKQPSEKKLTDSEEKAIDSWISEEGNRKMSSVMRQGKDDVSTKTLKSALNKMPSYNGTVYRGIGNLTKQQLDSIISKKEMDIGTITSSSKNLKNAQNFLHKNMKNNEENYGIMFKISSKNGKDLQSYEGEVALLPSSIYRIKNVGEIKPYSYQARTLGGGVSNRKDKKAKVVEIEVEEVPNDNKKIEVKKEPQKQPEQQKPRESKKIEVKPSMGEKIKSKGDELLSSGEGKGWLSEKDKMNDPILKRPTRTYFGNEISDQVLNDAGINHYGFEQIYYDHKLKTWKSKDLGKIKEKKLNEYLKKLSD